MCLFRDSHTSNSLQTSEKPIYERPKPLYGNVVSCDRAGLVKIMTYPSTSRQKKTQPVQTYSFALGSLPTSHQSRAVYRSIERWMQEKQEAYRLSSSEQKRLEVGPRVTFLDEQEYMQFSGEESPPVPAKDEGYMSAQSSSQSTASSKYEPPRRAVDVGLVWLVRLRHLF